MIRPAMFTVRVFTSSKLLGVVISLLIETRDDRRYVHELIDADCFSREVLLLHFLSRLHPQTLTLLLAVHRLILGKY